MKNKNVLVAYFSRTGENYNVGSKKSKVPQVTEEKVDTDGLGIGQAAEKIGALCGLALAEDRRGPVRRGLGRLATQIRHIR